MHAVIIKLKGKKLLTKADVAKLYKSNTITTETIVDKTKPSMSFENGLFINAKSSFLITTHIESRVAKCKTIETNKESDMPKRWEHKTKCPLDEIGKNSVIPCTKPRIKKYK